MTLNEYLSKLKRELYEKVVNGVVPEQGECDAQRLSELIAQAKPQIGTCVIKPNQLVFEFLFNLSDSTVIFPIVIVPPERVVFMPVPEWVVESIWQGEVAGTYRFESEACKLLSGFESALSPDNNPALFEQQKPIGRS